MRAASVSPVARGLFVTGTDTGVGKTLVACALLHALAVRGMRAVGMKPVAAGARTHEGQWLNEDVSALKAAGNVSAPDELVNPYCFEPAIAPHIAASQSRTRIEIARIEDAYAALAACADYVVVEGAGGFCVPLGPELDMAQVAGRLGVPVLLVVGMRLGCLNHALLTASAITAAGLLIAGWIANHIDRDMMCAHENVAALKERLPAPLLARVAHSASPDCMRVAMELDIEALVAKLNEVDMRAQKKRIE